MAFRTEFTPLAEYDLEDISDYLFWTHRDFGRSVEESVDLSARRIRAIRCDASRLAQAPFQGTVDRQFGEGIRHVTKDRAILYFAVDQASRTVSLLAIFYGAQDHAARMRKRLT